MLPAKIQTVRPYFQNLDTLRFLSFLVVFLFHVQFYKFLASHVDNPFLLNLAFIISIDGWGVSFFFVLSGFLITWLLFVEIANNKTVSIGNFYARRVLRIWPLYFLIVFVGYIVLPHLYTVLHRPIVFNYPFKYYGTFLSNYGALDNVNDKSMSTSFPLIMNISWSVSIEEQFYVVWPLFFALPQRFHKWIPAFFIALSFVAAILLSYSHESLFFSSFTRIGEIAVGGLFAVVIFHSKRIHHYIKNTPKYFIGAIYFFTALTIYCNNFLTYEPIIYYFFRMTSAVLFGLIIVEQNFSKHSFFKFGRLKLFSFLGKISYGLYMLHPIAMFIASVLLQMLLKKSAPVGTGGVFIVASFLLSIGMALASFYLFEKPILRLKKRFDFNTKSKEKSIDMKAENYKINV